jgi:hypothetical protein
VELHICCSNVMEELITFQNAVAGKFPITSVDDVSEFAKIL